MPESTILTEADIARLLRLDVTAVQGLFQRGELPGFEIAPGSLRCTEPAFFEWAERRSREGNGSEPEDPDARAEAQYARAAHDHFARLVGRGGPLPLLEAEELATPDARRNRPFRLDQVDADRGGLQITPLANGSASPIWIKADAVNRCLFFLESQVPAGESVSILASQNNPGPLARFTRRGNGGVRCLHYILPLLARCGRVEIDGESRPNTVRLAPIILQPAPPIDGGAHD
jgi:hypothetical protein